MADNDDGRVESRLAGIGRGFSATPERIAKLQQQSEAMTRQARAQPTRSFSKILGQKPEPSISRREQFRNKRRESLPRKALRPSGIAGRLRRQLESDLEEPSADDVILKG